MTDERRPTEAEDGSDTSSERDTEGHLVRPQFPIPPATARHPGPGEQVGGAEELLDDRDTEGHLQFRRRPGEGGE